jgi:hypothetical protein
MVHGENLSGLPAFGEAGLLMRPVLGRSSVDMRFKFREPVLLRYLLAADCVSLE